MRLAVLSDIHANGPAFEAVLAHVEAARPDQVLVGGDTINRGPCPRACLETVLDRIRTHQWRVIRGNHEDYILRASRGVSELKAWEQMVFAHTLWTFRHVEDYLPVIAAWPDELELPMPDGSTLVLAHASRKGNRVGLYSDMNDEELLDHAHPHAGIYCAGHTHIPFVRQVGSRWFVNVGAVGMPFDGDHRAAYALLDWFPDGWKIEIVRVPYDREATERAYLDSGYFAEGAPMTSLIRWELRHARPRLGYWHIRYEQAVDSGMISLEDSVQQVLTEPWPPTTLTPI